MTSTLVDATNFNAFSQVDITGYDPLYMANQFAVAHDIVAGHLKYDPAIQLHQNENGATDVGRQGPYMFQVVFFLNHHPLLSDVPYGAPGAVFTQLQLLFPAPFPYMDLLTNNQAINQVECTPSTGHVIVPFLGTGGLPGQFFAYGAGNSPLTGPVEYKASYYAGYAITSADRAAYPTAITVPPKMQQACAYIVEMLIAQNTRVAQDITNALNGPLAGYRNMEYEERYQKIDLTGKEDDLFQGTIQGRWAAKYLKNCVKGPAQKVMVV